MSVSIPWYALQTKPRNEKKVEHLLIQKGYECLLPKYRQKRQWSDRVVEAEMPLFPSYIFCRFNSNVLGKAISTPGVTRIVGFGGKPIEVDTEEIIALNLLDKSSLLREPWAYIPAGTLVQVKTGPLSGARGIFCSREDKGRLVISVTLLQRSVAIQLDENTVFTVLEEPVNDRKSARAVSEESNIALKLMSKKARASWMHLLFVGGSIVLQAAGIFS
jgi:transcription antitermination factor NusG